MLLPCVVCLPLLFVMVEWVWMGRGRHDGVLVDEMVDGNSRIATVEGGMVTLD